MIGTIVDASFNTDGTRLVTASKSGSAEIWDLRENRIVSILRGERKVLNYAAFSPDDRYVMTISQNGTIRVYYTHLDDVLALARRRVAELSASTAAP